MKDTILWQDRKRILGMPISFTKYLIKNNRLYVSKGLFSTDENEILLYQMYSYESILPCLYDGDPFVHSYTFTICLHPVHFECIEGRCPLDKTIKNSFLPNLDGVKNLNQENVKYILFNVNFS